MTYEEFLEANRGKLIAHYVLSQLSDSGNTLDYPWAPEILSDEGLDEFKSMLGHSMPMSVFTDLRDWDIHVEDDLSDDWLFEAAFGDASSLESCAEELAEFYMEKNAEYGIDNGLCDSDDDPALSDYMREQSIKFIRAWRDVIHSLFTQSVAQDDTANTPDSDA